MKKKSKKIQQGLTAEPESRSAKAVAKFIRIGPRKVRLVIDPIRYQRVPRAFQILMTFKKKAARIAEKVLKSAVANAKVLGMDENRLVVSKVWADGGPIMKRIMTRSMGRADRIMKRTTHLTVVVAEGRGGLTPAAAQAQDAEAKGKSKTSKKEPRPKKKAAPAGAK